MKKHLLILLMCMPLLNGCAFDFFSKIPPVVPPDKVVHIDARMFIPCDPSLAKLKDNAEMADILDATATNVKLYEDCKNKQSGSIKLLKEFSNYKESTP